MILLENMSILIVDDVKTMRSIVRKMLKSLNIGRVIHMAQNGVEALSILNSARVDFAIIDWKMPVMSGATLLEIIRRDKQLRDIPVLIVSAESEQDIVLEAAEIEVDGYLIKPLTPAILEKSITHIIDQVNSPDQATIHIKKARILEENNNYPAAIEHMKHAVQLKPAASRILRNLGLLYKKNGDEETMKKCLQKAALANPRDVITRHLLARFYWKNDDLILAAQYFLEVLSMTRKFSSQAIELGEQLLERNNNRLAKNIFSKTISRMEKDFQTKAKIIEICIEYKELEYSMQILKQAIKEYPSNIDLIFKAGVVCEMMGEIDKALEYFFMAEKAQGSRIDIKLKIARIFFDRKKPIQADNYLNTVLSRDPNNE
ncbi:MAG: response regulator, partial [Proteobacteria bacterium]|nr:response regulator [Pseudomonadota bacterium]